MQHADLKPIVASAASLPLQIVVPTELAAEPANGAIVATILPEEVNSEERPIPVTELIFAPRKKEMNKGFLMFSPQEGLTSEWHLNGKSLGIRCLL